MQFRWNKAKAVRVFKERGVNFSDAVELFARSYYLSQKNDDPEQWRAIGWVGNNLTTLIYEEREDEQGHYYWIVTGWKATKTERELFYEN